MAKVVFDDLPNTIDVAKASNGHLPYPYGDTDIAFYRGHQTWIRLNITDFHGYREITLEADFERYKIRSDGRHLGRVGFWAPVNDKPTPGTAANSIWGNHENRYSDNCFVILEDWQFGKKGVIKFDVANSKEDEEIQLVMCVTPFFKAEGDEKITKLDFTLTGRRTVTIEELDTSSLTFRLNERLRKGGQEIDLDILDGLGAMAFSGPGYSTHPKNLYSIYSLKNEIIESPKNLNIAYIGTDTTENLRSIIRNISSSDELSKKIHSFSIYYTDEWDNELLNRFPKLEIDASVSFPINKILIDNGMHLNSGKYGDADVILSTYVAPWALKNEKNRKNYEKLLTELMMNDEAKLISIDPASAENSVRAYLEGEFNLRAFYTNNMKLKESRSDIPTSEMISCRIWTKGGRVNG